MKDLTQDQWQEQLENDQNKMILDVRTPEEWEEGYIPGATLVDIREPQQFLDRIQALEKDKSYYVYCKSGGRSAQACQIMSQLGIENTYNLLGGFSEWNGETSNS
ncbi:rhodanese-like domain-containing protein [Mesonia sp. K7]|uniref:rhodanese-like domain-containing protein n=1 Tax=Mesonia sp. K7 TaxID=2218606 RepID=UPI000DA87A2F|nr:rhodanese-like domain-containing protein [Mesonia sp. K7]PZD79663.1 rhodanese-like domain-containing protein [Mesonia sp. K7]